MIVVRVLVVTLGVLLLVATLLSSVKTVILPRSVPSLISRAVFLFMRRVFQVIAHRKMAYARRDRILAWYAPMSLIGTLVAWLALVMAGYTLIFWGTDELNWVESFEMSGSALFTLGTTRPTNLASNALVFTEAAIGLFLLALLITFLPSIYTAFSRRELGVTALAVRAGEPPSGVEMMQRYWVLERMEELNDRVGVLVRRRRGDADVALVPGLLPIAPGRSLVGDRSRGRARRRRALGVHRGYRARRPGRVLSPGGVPVPAQDRRVLPRPLRRRP